MRRAMLLSTVVFLAAALVPISIGQATAANHYRTYVACGWAAGADPSHVCDINGKKAAFFKSKDAHVHYKVCVKFPDDTKLCAPAQDAPKGALRVNTIDSDQQGRHKVTWFVGGELINTWFFRNKNL